MLYPIELLLAEVHEKLDAPLSDDVRFLLATMEDKLRKPQLEAEGWFVACFSEDNDDLSQMVWRSQRTLPLRQPAAGSAVPQMSAG
jgi:hypothetical protein